MLCNGDWNDPGTKEQFLSTMTKKHVTCNQQGGYIAPCKAFYENVVTCKLRTGYLHHTLELFLHKDNPRKSQMVKYSVTKYLLPKTQT